MPDHNAFCLGPETLTRTRLFEILLSVSDDLVPEINKGLLRLSFVVVILLILANLVFAFFPEEVYRSERLEEPFRTLVRQLDLRREENVATWCTTSLLLLNALFAYTLRRQLQHTDPIVARYLGLLSIGFFLLSVDDLAQFHEDVEDVLEDGLEAYDLSTDHLGLGFGSLLALLLAILAYRGLARYLRRTEMALLAVSILCILMSVIAELAGTVADLSGRTAVYRLKVIAEEGGEVLALVFFLTLQYLLIKGVSEKTLPKEFDGKSRS